jgi:hypothetical protein
MNRAVTQTLLSTLIGLCLMAGQLRGQHQTSTFTPVQLGSALPYRIAVHEYDFGSGQLPGLHSYAAAQYGGKWIMLAGRTNGIHNLDQAGEGSFPEESQNRDVWVIDPVAKQSWHRSLGDPTMAGVDPASGLTPMQIASLTPTNNEFTQVGNTLYMAGGYGLDPTGAFTTFDTLTAINLPGLVDWVTTGNGHAINHIRQVTHSDASVTGGAMYEMGGRMHIVFGQDFEGPYSPRSDGAYTRQVRSFDIVDDGTTLAISNISQTAPASDYRRRDLNVVPVLRPDGVGGATEGLVALAGVFTSGFGTWTVPIVISADGIPSEANPALATTFKQGFNGYHSAKLGLYSPSTGTMNELLFGGISLQYLDPTSNQVMTDDGLPFVNDITSIVIDAGGHYSQHHEGYFSEILDRGGKPWRFGANAECFVNPQLSRFENGVIDLDQITSPTSLGYIFGGIATNGPHTRGVPDVTSTASYRIFEVLYAPAPEACTWHLAVTAFGVCTCLPRWTAIGRFDGTQTNSLQTSFQRIRTGKSV